MAALVTYPDEHGVAIATSGNLCLVVLTGQPVVPGLMRIVDVTGGVIAEHGGVATLTMARTGLPFPESDYRRRSAEVMFERQDAAVANVLALEGEGFWLAAARTVLAGIELLARSKQRLEVVSSLEEGIDFMGPRLTLPVGIDELKREARLWRDNYPGPAPVRRTKPVRGGA